MSRNILRVVQAKSILSEINVGKMWIRHRTTLILKFIIQLQRRFTSDPTLSDIDFKNKMAWVFLNYP